MVPHDSDGGMWLCMAVSWAGFLVFVGYSVMPLVRDRD